MDFITTDAAPAAGGHYSQAVVHNGFVFVAGQLAFVPGQKEHRPGPIVEQTEQTLREWSRQGRPDDDLRVGHLALG